MPKTVTRKKKRLGRGHGSGRVKTSGRGTKGQKARGKIPAHFEGGQLSVMKRLPYLRGKGRNKSRNDAPVIIPTSALSVLKDKTNVTLETLKEHAIIGDDSVNVKILAGGELTSVLTVSVPCSQGARVIIEKAGGTVK